MPAKMQALVMTRSSGAEIANVPQFYFRIRPDQLALDEEESS
jgi:hypothetical protein